MSVSQKSQATGMYRLMVYSRPLHPELFKLHARRTDRHGEYEVESWITQYGHVVRFNRGPQSVAEVMVDGGEHLPESGLVYALPCLGERDYEMPPTGKVSYVTTLQTEQLGDNLYNSTLREMEDFARETGAMQHAWTDIDGNACLSVLDTQKYRREFHLQAYHLLGSGGLVLRTQSIFEMTK